MTREHVTSSQPKIDDCLFTIRTGLFILLLYMDTSIINIRISSFVVTYPCKSHEFRPRILHTSIQNTEILDE